MRRPITREWALAWLLRGLGVIDLCAVFVAFCPNDVVLRINQVVGLSPLPDAPLVSYLIRSTSVLYALHGGLMLGLASDVVRYRPLIRLLGFLAVGHGIVIFGIDQAIGMPVWWTWMEGPVFAACGVAMLTLSSQPSGSSDASSVV